MPVFSAPPVGTQQTKKCSDGLLIAILKGVSVGNTMTKANKHVGPHRVSKAESTHASYEIFCLE
jgi:hypothetical protein